MGCIQPVHAMLQLVNRAHSAPRISGRDEKGRGAGVDWNVLDDDGLMIQQQLNPINWHNYQMKSVFKRRQQFLGLYTSQLIKATHNCNISHCVLERG